MKNSAVIIFVLSILLIVNLVLIFRPKTSSCTKENFLDFNKSENISRLVNEAVTSVLMSNSTNCTQSINTSQIIEFKNITIKCPKVTISNINQNSNVAPNLTCIQNSVNTADITNKVANEIKQKAEAAVKGLALGISSNDSRNLSDIANRIATNINMTNLTNCAQKTMQEQAFSIDGLKVDCGDSGEVKISDITQSITNQAVATCTSKNENTAKVVNDLQTFLSQYASSTTKGFDFGDIIGMVVAVILLIICLGGIKAMNSGGGDSGKSS